MANLEVSYRFACRFARSTAKNFYYSFLMLSPGLRRDMCVLYSFMRLTDDLGDDESLPLDERRQLLLDWEHRLQASLNDAGPGEEAADLDVLRLRSSAAVDSSEAARHRELVLPALRDIVRRHAIPQAALFQVIEGVRSDLDVRRFASFKELEEYCHLVAGAVGVCCIHIWGFDCQQGAATEAAIDTGTAFQLTNILRDLGEDLERGRLYLPLDDLQRFGLSEADLRSSVGTAPFRDLITWQIERARSYYQRGWNLAPALSGQGRRILQAMFRLYGALLREIERVDFNPFKDRIKLSLTRKLGIACQCLAPWHGKSPVP